MIDDYFHVEINATKFRLAESAEGDHYMCKGDPLRPNTYALVGGESDTFQMRPDTLMWSVTDWSGGEGQLRYRQQESSRYWRGDMMDPFTVRGALTAGRASEKTTLDAAAAFNRDVVLVVARSKLYAVDTADRLVYLWDDTNKIWGAGVTNSLGTTSTGAAYAVGDGRYLYYKETTTGKIFQYDGTTFVLWATVSDTTAVGNMVLVGDYIYVGNPVSGHVIEVPTTGAAPVTPATVLTARAASTTTRLSASRGTMTDGPNRAYFLINHYPTCVLWEIIPSTADGDAYASDIAHFDGFYGESVVYHLGFLYVLGQTSDDPGATGSQKAILYVQPDGAYGTLGEVRQGAAPVVGMSSGGTGVRNFTQAFFAHKSESSAKTSLWAIEAITGGVASVGRVDYTDADHEPAESMVMYRGEIFWATPVGSDTSGVWRVRKDRYQKPGTGEMFLETSVWDFGLVDEKVLESIRINCEPLPADWSIVVEYQLDQDNTWTAAGTLSTLAATNTAFVISTPAATKKFRNLQIRVEFEYAGGSSPTTTPTLYSLEVRARAIQLVTSYELLLELSDEDGQAQARSLRGTQQIANLIAAADTKSVVAFKDGYKSLNPNTFETVNVLVDQWGFTLAPAGEGLARVRLVVVS